MNVRANTPAVWDTWGTSKDGSGGAGNTGPEPDRTHLSERGSAMGIILPSDSSDYTKSDTWYARDLFPYMVEPYRDRYAARVDVQEPRECWPWMGYRLPSGYGMLSVGSRPVRATLYAHRISYVLHSGESLTDNLTIDHLCRVRSCVNPAHLEPVTVEENARRARAQERGGNPKQTPAEVRAADARRARARYARNHAAELARRSAPRTCPECGKVYPSRGLARHRRNLHGWAA